MKQYIVWFVVLVCPFVLKAQQTPTVDFKKIEGEISISPREQTVSGNLTVDFYIKKATDSIFLDAKNMKVDLLKRGSVKAKLHATENKLWIIYPFEAEKNYTLKFTYYVIPKRTIYFVGWNNEGSNQVWTQGQGKYTSYWLPSIDDVNDKLLFNLTYSVPEGYQVVANGKLSKHKTFANHAEWKYVMQHPMSSYLVAVAVGKYRKKEIVSTNGTPLEMYYEPKDSLKVEPTYRYSKEIFDFLEREIGVSYPWQNYKQIPVRDFLYAGMENTTATIFSNMFMTDSIGFIDRNYLNVNAHELAHQWFGDMVTETSSANHWLQEGFATYYALLAERELLGDDYYYFKLYQSAEQLKEMSDNGKGEALNDPKASSLTFYKKGAWALHILREKVGDEAFKEGIKNYLEKYKFSNVTTENLITEIEHASGMDLSGFVSDWIEQSAFKAGQALASLKKSIFIQQYLSIISLRKVSFEDKKEQLSRALDAPVNNYIGQEVVQQLVAENSVETLPLLQKAFASKNILVRQALATSLQEIPRDLKSEYETLLDDNSYLTQEKALFNLWKNFPSDRINYLTKMKGVEGFSNKNVKMEWLVLALVTNEYIAEPKGKLYQQLSAYTSPSYGYEIRENAFGYLYQIDAFSAQNYRDLLQGCEHPVWRFREFCRKLLNTLLKDNAHKKEILNQKANLSASQQEYLTKQL